jgi:hypothetical protein
MPRGKPPTPGLNCVATHGKFGRTVACDKRHLRNLVEPDCDLNASHQASDWVIPSGSFVAASPWALHQPSMTLDAQRFADGMRQACEPASHEVIEAWLLMLAKIIGVPDEQAFRGA